MHGNLRFPLQEHFLILFMPTLLEKGLIENINPFF